MTDRDKIKKILRREMKKISKHKITLSDNNFAFCFAQAKFDTLLDIDRELELGAFYRKEKK